MQFRNLTTNWITVTAVFCRLALGIIFFYAGIEKIIAPREFTLAVYNYQILPDSVINPVALVLPWLEVILAAGLVAGIYVRGASLISAVLCLVFSTAMTINLIRGLDIACGCFGRLSGNIHWLYLIRDTGLLTMSLIVLFFDRGWKQFFASSK